MSYFVVNRAAGPGWTDGTGAFDQPGADEHAAYMGALAEEGLLVCAGPVAGSEAGRVRVVLIAHAGSAAEIRARLSEDPWERVERLTTLSIEPWNVLLGDQRLAAVRS